MQRIGKEWKFPSPIGVIFSLILAGLEAIERECFMFPSPIGVIFSLMYTTIAIKTMKAKS